MIPKEKMSKRFHLIVACVLALAAFVAYQAFYGDQHNQAYASLSNEEMQNGLLNYKPALKRQLRSRLRDDVENILDLKGHDIVQIFDKPELVRRDLPTTIWQYRSERCVMDVYFTVGRAGNVGRENVVHYELRARDTRSSKKLNISACIKELAVRNTTMSMIDINAIYKASSE